MAKTKKKKSKKVSIDVSLPTSEYNQLAFIAKLSGNTKSAVISMMLATEILKVEIGKGYFDADFNYVGPARK